MAVVKNREKRIWFCRRDAWASVFRLRGRELPANRKNRTNDKPDRASRSPWIYNASFNCELENGCPRAERTKKGKKNSGNSTAVWRNQIVGRETRVRRCGKGIASGARRDLHPAWKRMRPGIQVQIVSQHCARELETVVMAKTILPLPPTREDFEEPDWSPPSVKFHDQRLIERLPRGRNTFILNRNWFIYRGDMKLIYLPLPVTFYFIIIRWKLLRNSQVNRFDATLLKSVFHFLSILSTAYNETDFLSITRLTVMTDDVRDRATRRTLSDVCYFIFMRDCILPTRLNWNIPVPLLPAEVRLGFILPSFY